MVNAEAFGQVHRQQRELEHRLESQRRLLEVNERLLATLDQSGVLEMIADSPQGGRDLRLARRSTASTAPPGPARRRLPRPVRRADPPARGPARRRDHRLGGPQRGGGARQRRARRPAIGADPGDARGAGVDDRRARCSSRARSSARSTSARMGGDESHFSRERVRARAAVRRPGVDRAANAEAHGAVDASPITTRSPACATTARSSASSATLVGPRGGRSRS